MIRILSAFFTRLSQRYLPNTFIFAALLTLLTFALGVLCEHQSVVQMAQYWGDGFWNLLKFSMQMVLILVTGHALAQAPIIRKILSMVASLAKTPGQAVMLTTFIAAIACWLNWGFGLVVGALLAVQMAKQVKKVHYALLVAAAYTGFLVWHAGLSGSIPLIIATPATGALSQLTGGHIIPLSQTIFAYANYVPVIILIVTLPFLNRMMMPRVEHVVEADPSLLQEHATIKTTITEQKKTPAQRLENSLIISMLIALVAIIYIVHYFITGGSLDINMVNLIFLTLGIILHKRPINYVNAVSESTTVAAGVVLQFPFYAGIMGMMMHSGLSASISQWFIHVANQRTFPLLAFYSSAVVNFFVPSGGGHWAVQGPFIMPAAKALGVAPAKAAMAIAWGEAWGNMIQPFWAIPILAIARLGIRDIMGFCTVALLWSGIILSLCIYFL